MWGVWRLWLRFDVDDTSLRLLERGRDADALLHVDLDVLGSHPFVLVLQKVHRGLGVARLGGLEHHVGHLQFGVGAALFLGLAGQRIQLLQPAQLSGA